MKNNSFVDYAVPDVVYVDVDGTLLIDEKVNYELVKWVRKQALEGKEIIVWSARGKHNAERAVEQCGIDDIVSHVLSKPGYVVDDLGYSWTQYMNILHVNEINEAAAPQKTGGTRVSFI